MTIPLLSIRGLSAGYDGVRILHAVDLEVEGGAFVSILGANGMGKTTLLRSILGLCQVQEGELLFRGKSLLGLKPYKRARRGLAILHDDRKIFASQTVSANLELAGRSTRTAERGPQLEFVYGLFPVLRERLGQRVGTMSGGEQQMVALSMCLMRKPDLLLLDEPSFGLAPVMVAQLARAFAPIVDRGMAIVLVEQNANLALSLADRCLVMQNGTFVLSGTPTELRQEADFEAAYFGL